MIFTERRAGQTWDQAQIVAQSLATGERTVLIEGGADARYVPPGRLVYALGDALFAVAFDAATLRVSGGPVPVVEGVARALNSGSANLGIAVDGTLAYMRGGASGGWGLAWIDRAGRVDPIAVPRRNYTYAQLSPDGMRVALDARDEENDIWIFDLARATLQRLTFDPGLNRVPIWSRDGRRVAFSREIDGGEEVFWQAADGSGRPEPLTADSGEPVFPSDFSPDGKALLFNDISEPWETRVVSIDAPGAGTRLFSGAGYAATISPDGRWVAYESRESGRREVYVRPYPDVESGRWQISTNGGSHPVWRRDGRELFYFESPGYQPQGRGALMAAPIETDGGFHPGSPQQLFANNFVIGQSTRPAYDVSLDGERFLMLTDADAGVPDRRDTGNVIIVENWVAELERLVPTP